MSEINAIGREIWDRLKMAFLRSELAGKGEELKAANAWITEAREENGSLRAELAAKDARIAELERHMYGNAGRYWEGRWRDEHARAERAEAHYTDAAADLMEWKAATERAEADADSLRSTIDNMRAMNIKLTFEATGKVLAAEAAANAMRGALEAFVSWWGLLGKGDYRPREIEVWLNSNECRDAVSKARAALNPSPAGPTPQPQDQSAQVEEASAEPRPPVSEFEASYRPRHDADAFHRLWLGLKGQS